MTKFDRFVRTYSKWNANIGTVLAMAIALVNIIDILGSKLFQSPVLGSVEIIGLTQAVMIAMAIASTQISKLHISVDIFISKFPKCIQSISESIISLVLFCVFTILVWKMVEFGIALQKTGEYSVTLRLPIHYFIYIVAFGLISTCLVFLFEFVSSVRRIMQWTKPL